MWDAMYSPVVYGDTVYICSDDHACALDATNGIERWKTNIDGCVSSSPAVYESTVYIGTTVYAGTRGRNGYVCALDAATGAEKWKYMAGKVYWFWSSPVVYESTVHICADDCVYALDAITGENEWKYRTGDNISSSPAVCSSTVYVGSQDRYVYALDATTGGVEWKYKTSRPIYSTPAISGETVYVRSTDRNLYALDRTTGKKKGAYRIDRHVYGFTKYSSPAVSENAIYINTDLGYVRALAPYDTSTLATTLVAAISQNTTLFVISVMLFGIIFIFSITYFIRRNYNSKIKDDTRFFIGLIATMILLWSSGFDPASGAIRTGAIVIVWMWAFIGLKSKYWRAFVGYYLFTSSVFWLYAIAMEISSDLWVRSEVMIACLPFLFCASFGTIPVFLLLMGAYIADKAGFIKKLRKYLNYLYKEKVIWGTNTKKHKEKRRESTNSDERKHETHKKSARSTKDDTRPYYYKVLDVSTDASRDEIKKAYRRLSMLYHPERPPTRMPRRR